MEVSLTQPFNFQVFRNLLGYSSQLHLPKYCSVRRRPETKGANRLIFGFLRNSIIGPHFFRNQATGTVIRYRKNSVILQNSPSTNGKSYIMSASKMYQYLLKGVLIFYDSKIDFSLSYLTFTNNNNIITLQCRQNSKKSLLK